MRQLGCATGILLAMLALAAPTRAQEHFPSRPVQVIVPATPQTHKIVNTDVLAALGPTGILVNVARGAVVDEDALVAALKTGKLGGAGLDVFADEPHVPEALFAMDNVTLLPHVGSATFETRRAMSQLVVDNLDAYFAGRPLLTEVK